MGMSYNVTFHDALIKPESYAALLGWGAEIAAEESPEETAEAAIEHVRGLLGDFSDPVQDEEGIFMDGDGYYDSASYGYGETLKGLLAHCEPGAYIHEIDAEESSGAQWMFVVQEDRTIKTVSGEIRFPGVDWPENLNELIADARTALLFDSPSPAVVDALSGTLTALVNALDPEGARG